MNCLLQTPEDAAALADHPDYELAAPTTDHFIPALHFAGLAAADATAANVLVDGYAYGVAGDDRLRTRGRTDGRRYIPVSRRCWQ